jgi:hypothetical protein
LLQRQNPRKDDGGAMRRSYDLKSPHQILIFCGAVPVKQWNPDVVIDVLLVDNLATSANCELIFTVPVPVANEILFGAVSVGDRDPDAVAEMLLVDNLATSANGELVPTIRGPVTNEVLISCDALPVDDRDPDCVAEVALVDNLATTANSKTHLGVPFLGSRKWVVVREVARTSRRIMFCNEVRESSIAVLSARKLLVRRAQGPCTSLYNLMGAAVASGVRAAGAAGWLRPGEGCPPLFIGPVHLVRFPATCCPKIGRIEAISVILRRCFEAKMEIPGYAVQSREAKTEIPLQISGKLRLESFETEIGTPSSYADRNLSIRVNALRESEQDSCDEANLKIPGERAGFDRPKSET